MERKIIEFIDGSILTFSSGAFDDWCVYLQELGSAKYAPRDTVYFESLAKLAIQYTGLKIYRDFVQIYDATDQSIKPEILSLIEVLSKSYGKDSLAFQKLLTIVYAGMVAEENKAHTKLGKKIKRLGMHQILLEAMPAAQAANFSKGKKWQEIDIDCKQRGF
jgi:hypothetical protein